jgi:glutamyl-tRNA synthetase
MKFTTGDTVVTFEKLWYLQRAHAERYATTGSPQLQAMVDNMEKCLHNLPYSEKVYHEWSAILDGREPRPYIEALVKADARNYTNSAEFIERNITFFKRPDEELLRGSNSRLVHRSVPRDIPNEVSYQVIANALNPLRDISLSDWDATNLRACVNDVIRKKTEETMETVHKDDDPARTTKQVQKSWSKITHQYLRWAISAGMPGPDGAEVMAIIGRKEIIRRLDEAAGVIGVDGFE